MFKYGQKRPQEHKTDVVYKKTAIADIRNVMRRVADDYRATDSVYDQKTDKLLLKEGNFISKERFEKLRDSGHYYTQRERKV